MPGFVLALSGGGARGFAHLGVLLEFTRAGLCPQALAGTSMGAIVGAMVACGQDLERWVHLLLALDLPEIFGVPASYGALVEWAVMASLMGKMRGRPWWKANAERTSRFLAFLRLLTKGKAFAELALPLVAVACDLQSGEEVRIAEGPVHLGVGASAALPGLVGPVRWRGRWLIDGGVVNPWPADVAGDWGETVVAVDATPAFAPEPHSLVDVVLRAYAITGRALGAVQRERARERLGERLILVEPELGDLGVLEFSRLSEAVEAGRAAARAVLPEVKNRV